MERSDTCRILNTKSRQVSLFDLPYPLFAIMREKTGSIWAPWIVHFVVDTWAVTVPGFWALGADG